MKTEKTNDIAVVIVNWNTGALLESALRSFVLDGIKSDHIVVIDQGSSDASASVVRHGFRGVRLITLPENRGYAAAVNVGASSVNARFLLVANADVRFDKRTLQQLKSVIDRDECIAAVGPRLVDSSGHDATRFSRTGGLRAILLLLLPSSFRGWWRRTEQKLNDADGPVPVSWIEGSFMLIRRSAFDEVGGFDESFSYFFEDGDFAIRLKKLGFGLYHCPTATVTHFGGSSFSQVPNKARVEFYKNYLLFYQRHLYRRSLWLKRLLVATLRLKLLVGRRKAESSEADRSLLQIIVDEKKRTGGSVLPDTPLVSIIVPTYGRIECLVTLLNSLKHQTYQKYEIIVVDQSDTIDPKKKVVFESYGRQLRLIRTCRRSRSHAKNLGIRFASGEVLLFVDDDIEIPEDLVSVHVSAYIDSSVGAVSCRLTEEGLPGLKSRGILKVTPCGQMVAGYQSDTTKYVHSLVGGDMSMLRTVQRQVGEFDPSYGGTSVFEEPDFSARILRSGYNILFTNRTTVTHNPQRNGSLDWKRTKPAEYYHWFHHNEILYFLKNHSLVNLFLVIPFCMLRTVKQSLKFHLRPRDAAFIFRGVVEGWRTYSRVYR